MTTHRLLFSKSTASLAAGTYRVRRTAGDALVQLLADGSVEVASSGIDMGQGTDTIPAQSAETLGVPVERVVVKLGDSAPSARAGNWGFATCEFVDGHRAQGRFGCSRLAINDPNSPYRDAQANTLVVSRSRIAPPRDDLGMPIAELMLATAAAGSRRYVT